MGLFPVEITNYRKTKEDIRLKDFLKKCSKIYFSEKPMKIYHQMLSKSQIQQNDKPINN